ncbi:hypothetical protein FRC06_007325, partial [Ceratobasidium sp. 370]
MLRTTLAESYSTPDSPASSKLAALDDERFQGVWATQSRFQRATLTSVSVSTSGLALASASLDSNILFINFQTGQLLGVLDFKGHFYVTSLLWCTDSLLYAGCSNGVLYAIAYRPANKHPIAMQSILNPFDNPITALALDPARNLLVVGSGGDTIIFSRPAHGAPVWNLVDHVPPPAAGRHGLVTALGFWGSSLEGYQLFIGYAKAGFCVWYDPGNYRQTPYGGDVSICSIGSAAISTDGKFVAIATLDHSVVIYPLQRTGLVIDRRQVVQNQEQAGYRPIVPIALMADKLILRGSTSGCIPVMDLHTGPLAPIQGDPGQIIRALTTYDDKVVVGSSDTAGHLSQIKCYSDRMSSTSICAWVQPNSDNPVFVVTIDELMTDSAEI